jgi:hypothetical protein
METYFEAVVKFKYLEMTEKNQNYIHKQFRADQIGGLFAAIRFRIFYMLFSYLEF